MSNKSKGSTMERELVKLFTEKGWRAARVAGSGVGDDSPCDIIAGKLGRKGVCVEVKSSRKETIYITKEQIEDFLLFSGMIGTKPVLALRFLREGWLFIDPTELRDTGKLLGVHLKDARIKGKKFNQYFGEEDKEEIPHDLTNDEVIE